LKRADAFRRPERFQQLIEVAQRDVPVVDTGRLERALEAASAVDAGAIAAQAKNPREIAQRIDAARVQAIERAL